MDELENKNHLLGGISSNLNEMQFKKLLRGTFFTERDSPSSRADSFCFVGKVSWSPSMGRKVAVHHWGAQVRLNRQRDGLKENQEPKLVRGLTLLLFYNRGCILHWKQWEKKGN